MSVFNIDNTCFLCRKSAY